MIIDGIPELMDICQDGKRSLHKMLDSVLNVNEIEKVQRVMFKLSLLS